MKDLQQSMLLGGDIELRDMVNLPNVIEVDEPEEDIKEWWPGVERALNVALDQLIHMRSVEGERLAADIEKRLGVIKELNRTIHQRVPCVVEDYRERIKQRIVDLKLQGVVDENRLAAEVAIFAERANITEETVRLNSHLEQMNWCLQSDEPVGRKLDFILQEMNREINTIGSKANDLEISNAVISVKSELEKIREQVQNIE